MEVITNKQKIFCIYVCVSAGSIYEEPQEAGMSHVLEHMLLKRTKKYSESILISKLAEMGGITNATTDKDMTCYYVYTVSDNWRQAVDIMASVVREIDIRPDELAKEKQVVVEEINMRRDKFMDLYNLAVSSVLAPGNPYDKHVEGTTSKILNLNRSSLVSYYKKRYGTYVVLANCPGQIKRQVSKYISAKFGLHEKPIPSPSNDLPKFRNGVFVINRDKSQYTHMISFPTYPKKEYKKNIIVNFIRFAVINGSFKSRLMYILRTRLALVYHISSSNDVYRDIGLLNIESSTTTNNLMKIISVFVSVMKKLHEQGLSEKDLRFFKKAYLSNKKLVFANEEFRTSWHAENLFYGCDIPEKDYTDHIKSITNDDIISVSKEVLSFERMGILSFGRYANPKKEAKLLHNYVMSLY
jgi:predicted Zn-dependent peptidase